MGSTHKIAFTTGEGDFSTMFIKYIRRTDESFQSVMSGYVRKVVLKRKGKEWIIRNRKVDMPTNVNDVWIVKLDEVDYVAERMSKRNWIQKRLIQEGLGKQKLDSVIVRELQNLTNRMKTCLLYTSPSPRDATLSRMPSSA